MSRRPDGYRVRYRGPSRGYYLRFTKGGKRYDVALGTKDAEYAGKLAADTYAAAMETAPTEFGQAILALLPLVAPGCAGVYAVRNAIGHVKIGRASNIAYRLKKLQTANSERLELVAVLSWNVRHERAAHRRLKAMRVSGEWFAPSALLWELVSSARGRR